MAEYIKREAALREIERREAFMVGDKYISVDSMITFIKNRPAADVVPVVHGYWIKPNNDDGLTACSCCHHIASWCWERTPYCPECGAKMDGGDNNEVV